ncbi:MAG: heparan-alpha-glucosaminide N-acetyltransferase domain-containing protein, partial [Chloroflexota bacterium]
MAGRSHSVTGSSRLLAVDALRGFIIVLMALDHANYFIAQKHSPGEYWGGSFPTYSEALPFLTRFVTHLAAPGFFFLMGAGMALFKAKQTRKSRSRPQIVAHFWIRGGLLIAVQFLIVNQVWRMSPGGWGPSIYIGVLFALGGAMIICSLFLWWRSTYLLMLAATLFIA